MKTSFIFSAGVVTGALAIVIALFFWKTPSKEESLAAYVRSEQSRLRILCSEVASTGQRVVREDVPRMLDAAREGKSLIATDDVGVLMLVSRLAVGTRECSRLERAAREAKYPFESFEKISRLFEMLEPTLHLYQTGSPEQRAKLKGSLQLIESLYSDLTAASTPTRAEAARAGEAGRWVAIDRQG